MPTGWRPADVALKYPVYKIEDPYNFQKYDPPSSTLLAVWSWEQLIMLLLFISYLFGNIAAIGKPDMFIYGAFVFLMVYAFTELMDGSRYAVLWEVLKAASGIAIIFYQGDWFGISVYAPAIKYVLVFYFLLSVGMANWINKENKTTAIA